jgi:hypothetical protein
VAQQDKDRQHLLLGIQDGIALLVNLNHGQARNGSRLLRCCTRLVTLLWLEAAVAVAAVAVAVQAVY